MLLYFFLDLQYLTTLTGELRSKKILEKATSLLLKEKPVGIVIGRPNYVIQSQSEVIFILNRA